MQANTQSDVRLKLAIAIPDGAMAADDLNAMRVESERSSPKHARERSRITCPRKVISECTERTPPPATFWMQGGHLVAAASAQDDALAQMASKATEEFVGQSTAPPTGAKPPASSLSSPGPASSGSDYSDSEEEDSKSTATTRKTGPKPPSNQAQRSMESGTQQRSEAAPPNMSPPLGIPLGEAPRLSDERGGLGDGAKAAQAPPTKGAPMPEALDVQPPRILQTFRVNFS